MANITGLFDGLVDPRQKEFENQQSFMNQLGTAVTPRSFNALVGTNLGRQLSGGAMGLMGVMSPEQERFNKIQQAMQDAQSGGGNEADKLSRLADALEAQGLASDAFRVRQQARQLGSEALADTGRKMDIAGKRTVYRPRYVTIKVPAKDPLTGLPIPGQFTEKSIQVTDIYEWDDATGQYKLKEEGKAPAEAKPQGQGTYDEAGTKITNKQIKDAIEGSPGLVQQALDTLGLGPSRETTTGDTGSVLSQRTASVENAPPVNPSAERDWAMTSEFPQVSEQQQAGEQVIVDKMAAIVSNSQMSKRERDQALSDLMKEAAAMGMTKADVNRAYALKKKDDLKRTNIPSRPPVANVYVPQQSLGLFR